MENTKPVKKDQPSFYRYKYLTLEQAAFYLADVCLEVLIEWTKEYNVALQKIGNELKYRKADLDAMMFKMTQDN